MYTMLPNEKKKKKMNPMFNNVADYLIDCMQVKCSVKLRLSAGVFNT